MGGGGPCLGAREEVDLGDEHSPGGARLAVFSVRVVIELEDADAVGQAPGAGVAEARHLAGVHVV